MGREWMAGWRAAVERHPLRQALFLSVLLHVLLLPLAGAWSAGALREPAEMVVELELEDNRASQDVPALTEPAANVAAAPPAALPGTMAAPNASAAPVPSAPAAALAGTPETSAETTSWTPAEPAGESAAPSGGSGSGTAAAAPGAAAPGSAAPGGGQKRSGGFTPPRLLEKAEPVYPQEARSQGVEGTVGIKIEIAENGLPADCRVIRSSGSASLDSAALAAVGRWRFVPARDLGSGAPVRCYSTVNVVFRLK